MNCPFCDVPSKLMLIESELCFLMETGDPVLTGSGMTLPREHRPTVFDLTGDEWRETGSLLNEVKALLDRKYSPDGYNVGWNCGEVGGQSVDHAHLHVIPRFRDEPLAGRGIRHHLKQEANRRIQ